MCTTRVAATCATTVGQSPGVGDRPIFVADRLAGELLVSKCVSSQTRRRASDLEPLNPSESKMPVRHTYSGDPPHRPGTSLPPAQPLGNRRGSDWGISDAA